jgi:ferric-dicitrate binding protein FerR (iron transport regulator)
MRDNKLYSDLFEKYIAGEAEDQEIRELLSFLRTNPRVNHWLEQQINRSSSGISEDLKQQMFDEIQESIDRTEKPNNFKWRHIAAAIFLPVVLAFGGYYFYSNHQSDAGEPLIVMAERGEKSNVTLPDGSRVWLNSGSKLTYHNTYNRKERLLNLDGEAYFEVVSDTRKKFIVQCEDMKVEVLGTTFGIKAYDEDSIISAVLVEGKVQLTLCGQTKIMKPNERVVFNKTKQKTSSEIVIPNHFTEWRRNRLRFENETFQDVAKTIARIHNIDYTFADESIRDFRFTGSVDNTSIESVLNAITLTSSITYTMKNGRIIFHKDDRKKGYFHN